MEQLNSELVASEQATENIESLEASPAVTLTEAEKAVIAQMLARLDDLMRQAVEIKNKMEAASTLVNKIDGNQSQTFSGSGGGGGVGGGSDSGSNSDGNSPTSGGGSTTTQSFPKLLISEIQLASASSSHEEFLELYNPNPAAVDLTDWYIQKKTAGGARSTKESELEKLRDVHQYSTAGGRTRRSLRGIGAEPLHLSRRAHGDCHHTSWSRRRPSLLLH